MKWHRIKAMLIRYLYLYRNSLPRLMDIFYWPVVDVVLWGFLSLYIAKINQGSVNLVSVLLGALLFWNLIQHSQQAISVTFLEEVWEKNLLNIFVTPLRVSEYLASTVLLGLIRIVLMAIVMSVLALFLYHFNFLSLGFYIIPFFASLLLFGFALGIFTTSLILHFGNEAEILAWGLIFIIQPFTAVFYPVSALPHAIEHISYALPSTYIFEGMRAVLSHKTFPLSDLIWSFGLNLIYLTGALWFFYFIFAKVKQKGRLMKLD